MDTRAISPIANPQTRSGQGDASYHTQLADFCQLASKEGPRENGPAPSRVSSQVRPDSSRMASILGSEGSSRLALPRLTHPNQQ